MSQPYENIYLGNFILTLGYIAGKNGLPLIRTALQQLQQTPADTSIGDLFANWGGKNFIFEFKRTEQQVRSEFVKPQRAKLLKAISFPELELLRTISERCHFMCFPIRSSTSTLSFMPYALIQNCSAQNPEHCIDLSKFCALLLDSSINIGVPYKGIAAYLELLVKMLGDNPPPSSGGGPCVIMNISDAGDISMVEASDLRVLAKTLDFEPPTPTKDLEPTRSRGFER